MSRPAPPRTSGSCFYCYSKRVRCDATQPGGSYPCQRCIDKDQDLTKCRPHLEDERWIPGKSGATHARGGQSSGGVSKPTKSKNASPKKASPKEASPKKALPKKPSPKKGKPTQELQTRSSTRIAANAANNNPSGHENGSDYNSSDFYGTDPDEPVPQQQEQPETVTSRFNRYVREETQRTGINPIEALHQQQEDEWRAVQRMTLGELRTARAEERATMGPNGVRRLFTPPPGPDDAVLGDLVGLSRARSVPVKPQLPEQDDF